MVPGWYCSGKWHYIQYFTVLVLQHESMQQRSNNSHNVPSAQQCPKRGDLALRVTPVHNNTTTLIQPQCMLKHDPVLTVLSLPLKGHMAAQQANPRKALYMLTPLETVSNPELPLSCCRQCRRAQCVPLNAAHTSKGLLRLPAAPLPGVPLLQQHASLPLLPAPLRPAGLPVSPAAACCAAAAS